MNKIIDIGGSKKKILSIVVGVIAFFVILSLAGRFFTVIDAGQIGVVSVLGKVKDDSLGSGFHIINPLAKVIKMDVKTQEYTMSIVPNEGQKMGDDSIDVLTNEGLTLKLDVTVFFRLNKNEAAKVYKEIGIDYQQKIVRPEIRSAIRDTAAKYSAQEVYSTKREILASELKDLLSAKLENRGLIFEDALIRNIILPQEIQSAIEGKQAAEQEAQKMQFVLDKEKKEAERKKIESEGIRDAQEIIAQKLSNAYLQWYAIDMMKTLSENKSSTFIFVPIGQNGMPIVNINPNK